MWMPGFLLDNLSLVLCVIVLAIAVISKSGKSEIVALAVWIALGVLMSLVSADILALAKLVSINGYLVWYGSWALFDLLGVCLIYMLHKLCDCSASKLAVFISISFVILAVLQWVGYMDRGVLGWKAADDFYRYMILAVNIAIVPMAGMYVWPSFKNNVLPRLLSLSR